MSAPRWDPLRRLCALSLVLAMPACSGGAEGGRNRPDEAAVPRPPILRDSAGVTIVENVEPQWAPGSEWRIGALLTSIGDTPGDPAHQLFRAIDATRQSDGTVAVGNSASGEIRLFRQDGTFMRQFGSTGGGPGEFRGANALRKVRRIAGDTLLTWDIYGQTVSVFTPDGEYVRSFGLDGPARQHFWAGAFADRSILMRVLDPGWTGGPENIPEGLTRGTLTLHHYGSDHRLSNSLTDIPDSEGFRARWGPWGSIAGDAPFGRVTTIQAGGEEIYVATGDADEVAVYHQSGTLERLIRRSVEPVQVTPEMVSHDKAARVEGDSAQLERYDVEPRVRRMIEELPYPAVLPPYGRTVLDSEMNLWVEAFRASEDDPADWSVFDKEGIWLGRVTLPKGLEVYEIGADYILGRILGELEVERIEVYEIVRT